jgi:hypothetical protein
MEYLIQKSFVTETKTKANRTKKHLKLNRLAKN